MQHILETRQRRDLLLEAALCSYLALPAEMSTYTHAPNLTVNSPGSSPTSPVSA
jgi:hypothetical protein